MIPKKSLLDSGVVPNRSTATLKLRDTLKLPGTGESDVDVSIGCTDEIALLIPSVHKAVFSVFGLL